MALDACGLDPDRRNAGVPDQRHALHLGAIGIAGLQSRKAELFDQIVDREGFAGSSCSAAEREKRYGEDEILLAHADEITFTSRPKLSVRSAESTDRCPVARSV